MKSNVDLTELGEEWVNTSLDFQSCIKNTPKKEPYAVFYGWGVKGSDGQYVSSCNLEATDTIAFMCSLHTLFKEDVTIVPSVLAAVASFINTLPEEKKDEFRDACSKIIYNKELTLE